MEPDPDMQIRSQWSWSSTSPWKRVGFKEVVVNSHQKCCICVHRSVHVLMRLYPDSFIKGKHSFFVNDTVCNDLMRSQRRTRASLWVRQNTPTQVCLKAKHVHYRSNRLELVQQDVLNPLPTSNHPSLFNTPTLTYLQKWGGSNHVVEPLQRKPIQEFPHCCI